MKTDYQIQVGSRGVVTLPKKLRDKNQISKGDFLSVYELSEGVFVIGKKVSRMDKLFDEIAKEWEDTGESLESMLLTLREVREEYHTDHDKDLS